MAVIRKVSLNRLAWAGVAATVLTALSFLSIFDVTIVPNIVGTPGALVGIGMVRFLPHAPFLVAMLAGFIVNMVVWTVCFYALATAIFGRRRATGRA